MSSAKPADVASGLDAVLARYVAGELSPPVAMMQLLIESESYERAVQAIETGMREAGSGKRERLAVVSELARTHEAGCRRIADMLRADMDSAAPARSVDEGIAFCQRLFDWSVRQSEEASVALYSLGNAALLNESTSEIVDQLEAWRVLGRDRDVLHIGCGIGRIEAAIAGKVRTAHGIDVSAGMIEAARRRCMEHANVHLARSSGHDLSLYGDQSFDLVYAVDTFPYLVQSGAELVSRHFEEAHRVLRPGGDFIIFNFSDRGDVAADVSDVNELAQANGFDVIVSGIQPFRIWDGVVFHLRDAGRGTRDEKG